MNDKPMSEWTVEELLAHEQAKRDAEKAARKQKRDDRRKRRE